MAKLMMGTEEVLKVMMGSEEVTSLFMGSEEIPSSGSPEPVIDYSTMPFTIEALESGNITFEKGGGLSSSNVPNCSYLYSINGGAPQSITFEASVVTSHTISVSVGDVIEFTVSGQTQGTSGGNYKTYLTFKGTVDYKVYGNILSLCYPDYQNNTTLPGAYCFYGLFRNSRVVDAENLVLPNDTTNSCYFELFKGSKLVSSPQLPCTGSIAISAYNSMFCGCTSLVTTQVLPGTTLGSSAYKYMYKGASSVSRIECFATDISAADCLKDWVNGVSATGTFVKDANTTWPSGGSGIPTGWTVVDA